jgi:transposase
MFIKKTSKTVKGKTYVNHLLVESISTPKGPRHRVVCSLGNLAPAPQEEWLALARKIEAALLGQPGLEADERVDAIVERVRTKGGQRRRSAAKGTPASHADVVAVHTDGVEVEEAREAGPVHVGHQFWQRLDVDAILADVGLCTKTRLLTQVMTLNRLIQPLSEHAMVDWVHRTAMADILATDLTRLNDEALYRNLDRLHPQRAAIERGLVEREQTLFNLDSSVYLYDVTSTYFEGRCEKNPQATLGYSRDDRPDCKQVVVGLVMDRDGFPKAHEVFDGNRTDRTTVSDMLDRLEARVGRRQGATVVVDRGMAFDDNLRELTDRGYHYIVAARQTERDAHLADYEEGEGWQPIERQPSPRNAAQVKTAVSITQRVVDGEVHILCRSEGREAKDRAIRDKQEARLLADLDRLQKRIAAGRLVDEGKVHQAIGRLRERFPRVGRYYDIAYDADGRRLSWTENVEKKDRAKQLDGTYLLKTDRSDMTEEEIWRTYMLLTRVEAAFRAMKSPLMERPIWHQLEHRVQTHIFLCVLAYHLLVAIEKTFLDRGVHTSWGTLRELLTTHQVVTVVLPATNGMTLRIRKGTTPEDAHQRIYEILEIPAEVMRPVKTWGPTVVTENGLQ